MTHKLIKTDNYMFVLEHSRIKRGDTVKYDNGYFTATHDNYHNSLMKIIAHLPINGSPILEGVDLLDINLILNYLKELGYWNDFCTFAETFYNEKKHIKDTN